MEQRNEKLIDFSSDDEKSDFTENCNKQSFETPKIYETEQNNSPECQRNYSRLCGYLNKLGNQRILRTFRKRWFVFSENNCKLYYYRSPQDAISLGEIDISRATFFIEVHKERCGLFTISVPGRDYFLEANSQQTALFWLQELQKYRRTYSLLHTKHLSVQTTSVDTLSGRPQSGLLAEDFLSMKSVEEEKNASLMLPVDCPNDIGDDAITVGSNNPFVSAQQKLSDFCNQMKLPSSVKGEKSPSESSHSSPCKEVSTPESSVSSSFALKSTGEGESFSVQKNFKSSSLSTFRSKISSSFRKVRLSEDGSIDENCVSCHNLKTEVTSLTDEVSNLQIEVTAGREVITLLQQQLDITSKEKETLMQMYQLNDAKEYLKMLNEKDEQIIKHVHDTQKLKEELEKLQQHVVSLKMEVTDLQKSNQLFQEMLMQKDKTIMTLTNEVFEMETEKQDEMHRNREPSISEAQKVEVSPKETMSYEDLKDAVQAFEFQNRFLNNELLELNKLRRDDEERFHLLSVKCSEWEARSYQMQSKLLFLLNELKRTGNSNHKIVSELLQEGREEGAAFTNIIPSWSRENMYDELGFNWKWAKEDLLSTKASNLKQKSEIISNKAKDPELATWHSKWDNFVVSLGSKDLQRSAELKALIRMGVPHEYKGKIWNGCVKMWLKNEKQHLTSNYYNILLTSKEYISKLDPSSKQIELDLLRTLPNNRHYEDLDSDGIPKLRRVLLAYSRHDPIIGYCQGLNRLAAIALLFLDEESAFWCLVAITTYIMPKGYYNRTLIASLVDQRVLKDIMADKLPRLHSHFEQNNVDLSLFTFNWFLTVFVDNIPVDIYLRIWDAFLYEGSKVLFRFALAFFKLCENEILEMNDYMAINKYLRNIADQNIDVKKLAHIITAPVYHKSQITWDDLDISEDELSY
ncbi:TBC1 domain family member 2B-like isoform X3 [Stegodyphus dumicola]|uniref:TBC1 domain family member 2B-like isoform X3 n=1 Tax=Stegodyphus dumicola TaxID=202533 RepID=UPI0015A8D0B9|nr:TBC1 domain family member 2B-like isoform X3 [Stegodyphus dumicola]